MNWRAERVRRPRHYYTRLRTLKQGYLPQTYLPLTRSRVLTVLPLRNWTIGEMTELHRNLGQRFSVRLEA